MEEEEEEEEESVLSFSFVGLCSQLDSLNPPQTSQPSAKGGGEECVCESLCVWELRRHYLILFTVAGT